MSEMISSRVNRNSYPSELKITDVRFTDIVGAPMLLQIPRTVPLWKEAPLRAWAAENLKGELTGVVHPATPPSLSPLLETTEEEYARARDEGPLAAWCVTKVFGEILRAQQSAVPRINSPCGHRKSRPVSGAAQLLSVQLMSGHSATER